MSQDLSIDMPRQDTPLPFWRKRRNLLIMLFAAIVLLAGIFSWWLSGGKISSVAARLDTIVYTVESEYPALLESVYARPGDAVSAGQPLARIDLNVNPGQIQPGSAAIPGSGNSRDQEILRRLAAAQQMERDMSARVSQARSDEDRLRNLWQESVTEHVRAQLAMRSLEGRNRGAYHQASQTEQAYRAKMEAARDNFEQASKMRAAMGVELDKIRAEIYRAKQITGNKKLPEPKPARQTPVYEDVTLASPIDGKVMQINAAAGQMLAPGQPVFLVLPTGKEYAADSWIQAWFPLADKDKIKPGQKVSVRLGNNGAHISGKVTAISSESQFAPPQGTDANKASSLGKADPETGEKAQRYLPVKITPDNPEDIKDLPPGINAECQIQTRYALGIF